MSFITLDFETFFRSAKNKGSIGPRYSLSDKTTTYETYIRDPEFKVHGVGIKIDAGKTNYYPERDVQAVLTEEIFLRGNDHTMLAHNTPFDGAILSWYYGLRAAKYYDTQGMSQALWAQGSASLASLCRRLWPTDKTKRKGKELVSFDGVKDLDDEQQIIMGGYCGNDTDLTFDAFRTMYPFFPISELDVIDLTLQMFIHPAFVLERQGVIEYQNKLLAERAALIAASGLREKQLSSNLQFCAYLKNEHGIIVPMKASPTKTNPNNITEALAKDDTEFLLLQANYPELKHVWEARIVVKSSSELTRCKQVLSHAEVSHINPLGLIAVPLKYCGAHTKRFSGYNKVNFQNFKRKSPLRAALYAPPGFKVAVRDLAAIEGRTGSWFFEHTEKLDMYRNKVDVYSKNATDIFARPVDRKRKLQDTAGNYLNKTGQICDKDDAHCPDEMEGNVGKVAELSLTYQMGATKFQTRLFLADVPDATADFAKKVVTTWRAKNAPIVKGWARCEQVIYDMARKDLEPYKWRCLVVEKEAVVLPNGLRMTYPGLRAVEDEQGRMKFEYWEGKFWKSLYGGLFFENINQALARIVMTDMMRAINKRIAPLGGRVVLTVHDELVFIAPDAAMAECMAIAEEEMNRTPSWCDDGTLVLTSEGGIAQNYSK